MSPWITGIIGLFVGSVFTLYCVSWVIAAAVKSQGPTIDPEVEDRLEAEYRAEMERRATWN